MEPKPDEEEPQTREKDSQTRVFSAYIDLAASGFKLVGKTMEELGTGLSDAINSFFKNLSR